jgi:hypothetical protein
MPLIRADRVKESSTSTSTSAFLLNGADSTYCTFASVCAVGDTVYYAIAHRSANEWEVGLGTYSATNTLTRTTVHASSNANAAVAFSTGTKDVLLALTKAQLETYATLAGTETLTNKTISGANNTITNVSLTTGATGTLPLANGGTGTTTAQLAINALAGAVTSGNYLRGNGTNVVMAAIQAADVPTLNQSTTGTASGSVSGTASYLAKFTGTNVVGNSLIYDSGTNIGISTTSPISTLQVGAGPASPSVTGTKLWVASNTGNPTAVSGTGTTLAVFVGGGIYVLGDSTSDQAAFLFRGADAAGSKTRMLFLGDSSSKNSSIANVVDTQGQSGHLTFDTAPSVATGLVERMRITSAGNVGIGTTSPSGRVHVRSSASSTWMVYLQNSAGTYAGGIYQSSTNNTGLYLADSAGADKVQLIAQSSTSSFIATGANFGIGTTTPASGLHVANVVSIFESSAAASKVVIVKGAAAQSANLQEWQDSASTAVASIASNGSITITNGANIKLELARTAFQWSGIRFTDTAGSFDMNGGGDGLLLITPAASKKALQVRGSASQAANLQEWQNSAGTALATVNASGSLATSGSITSSSGLKTSYTNEYDFLRAAPTTVGDYVEICSYFSFSNSLEITAVSQQGAGIGTTVKKYIFNSVYGWWNFTLAPIAMERQGGYTSTFDFELEVGPPDGGFNVPLRLRRTAGTSARNVLITVKNISVYGHDLTPLSGTGTSAISLTNINGVYINPVNYALPVAGTSGNGRDIGFYAGSAIGTGAGGNILLYTGAGAGGGVGGAILSRSQADSYNRSNKFILVRSIPDTVGNYVELGRIGWLSGAILKVSVFASRGAYDAALGAYNALGKEYEIYTHYYSSGTVAPRTVSGGSQGGRQPNEFELELAFNSGLGSQILRLRRSKADATNFSGYTATVVIEQLIWSPHAFEFVELSGTGTSALTNAYLTNTGTYCYPALIPPPTVGTSGAGTDLAIYGGSAAGTGDGGSILLQAGAFSTSGSNGKVIVRGLASNTANLQEWQNNAGTALASVDSSGRLTIASSATASNADLYINNASSVNPSIKWNSVSGQTGLRFYSGSTLIGAFQDNGAVRGSSFSTWGGMNFGDFYVQRGSGGIISFNSSTSPAISIGAGASTSAASTIQVTTPAAGKIGLVVQGSPSQSANLQEWQNNAGTALALVDASGNVQTAGSIWITSNTPSAFTADQNNLALTASGFQRLSGTAARNITGIAPPSGSHVDGRMIRIYNVGTFNLTLKHNNANSTAANRFWNVQAIDIIVGANDYAELIYDGTNNGSGAAGWRVA